MRTATNKLKISSLTLFITLICLCTTSCKFVIDLDYKNIEPIWVIESEVGNGEAKVKITHTKNMESLALYNGIDAASKVIITDSQNNSTELFYYEECGLYLPNQTINTTAGETFTINVEIEGKEFSSYSKVEEPVVIDSTFFKLVSSMPPGSKSLTCLSAISDLSIGNELRYYYNRLFINDELSRWSISTNQTAVQGVISLAFPLRYKKEMKPTDDTTRHNIVDDGDWLRVEVRSIDRRTYEYFYSMNVGDMSGSNPYPNFSGGCLGYFMAFSEEVNEIQFFNKNVL